MPILFLGRFYQRKLFCLGSESISQISNPQIEPSYAADENDQNGHQQISSPIYVNNIDTQNS